MEILCCRLFYSYGYCCRALDYGRFYYMFLLPADLFGNWDAWKENLLLSRFAAPTSAGILFTMLAAAGLRREWIYKKTQVLAIFDDLDTILLMIPLQIFMIGFKWQLFAVVIGITFY